MTKSVAKGGSSYLQTSTISKYVQKYVFQFVDLHVFIVDVLKDKVQTLLNAVSHRPVRLSIVVLKTLWMDSEMTIFKNNLYRFKLDSQFYLVVPSENGVTWFQVITLKSGYSMTELRFSRNTLQIIEDYDLNGLTITSISLSLAPYLTLENCDQSGKNCTVYGYLKDYADVLAKQFNFTYESHKDVNGDWGVLPKSGPFNRSGEWSGVMGNVINSKYDLCLSSWSWWRERYDLLTFVGMLYSKVVLLWTPKPRETDFELLLRPFTNDSWIAVFFTTAISSVVIVIAHYGTPSTMDTLGKKIMVTTLWYFFVLLNAYYGGAMTMFFTSTISNPFEGELIET
jgi:hypothetical protein